MVKKTHGGKNEKKLRLKNEKNLQFKKHTNKHHIYPTSRFILKKNPVLHTAWHDVFEDSTPEEAVEKVEEWMTDSKKFKEEVMENERKTKAWEMLFSGLTTPPR